MKKISKESLQNFLLLHAEKLILGVCLAATGLFVWNSLGSEKELKDTPSKLLAKGKDAESYVNRPAWEQLEPFREGKADAEEKIVDAKRVDPEKFPFAIMGGVAQTLLSRQDPMIFGPEQPLATRVTAGVLLDQGYKSALADFRKAPAVAAAAEKQGGAGDGDFSSGGGNLPEGYPRLSRSGVFHPVNELTADGLRPKGFEIPAESITNSVVDAVAVRAVVDFQKQSTEFERAFSESVAYNAKRDRLVYQFLQVQRREVSDKETEWVDISENVTYTIPQLYPKSLTRMPFQMFRSAPEVISPDNYDPITSQVIPAFTMLDYQELATHPALTQRRQFPAWTPKGERKVATGGIGQILKNQRRDDDQEEDPNLMRSGSATQPFINAVAMRKPGGQYRLVRFFDLQAPSDTAFEYRMRVWVNDPNQTDPNKGFATQRGMTVQAGDDGDVRFASDENGGSAMEMPDMDKEGGEDQKVEVIQEIRPGNLAPAVRNRLRAATDLEEMQQRLADAARNGEPMVPFEVAEFSEDGEKTMIKLPPSARGYAYTRYLRFARPSPWSDTVRVDKKLPSADVFAGGTYRSKKQMSFDAGSGDVQFDQVEPEIKVVTSSWNRRLGTKLPSTKRVHVGETLNYDAPAYVTHPITSEVLIAENLQVASDDINRFMLPIRTDTTIVDAFMGQRLDLSKRQTIEMPTEVLTRDINGNLKVSNQFDDETRYRNEITQEDSSRFYGKPPKPRKSKKKDQEGINDFEDQ